MDHFVYSPGESSAADQPACLTITHHAHPLFSATRKLVRFPVPSSLSRPIRVLGNRFSLYPPPAVGTLSGGPVRRMSR